MRLYVALTLLVVVAIIHQTIGAGTNCGVGTECSSCSNKKTLRFRINGKGFKATICCKSCNKYFRYGIRIRSGKVQPWCTCDYDRMGGTCWKGDQCSSCDQKYVGKVNKMPVCCSKCLKKGLILSPTNCNCNV